MWKLIHEISLSFWTKFSLHFGRSCPHGHPCPNGQQLPPSPEFYSSTFHWKMDNNEEYVWVEAMLGKPIKFWPLKTLKPRQLNSSERCFILSTLFLFFLFLTVNSKLLLDQIFHSLKKNKGTNKDWSLGWWGGFLAGNHKFCRKVNHCIFFQFFFLSKSSP